MCKEMPVIPVNRVVDNKRIIRKKWRAEKEEERHKGPLTAPPPPKKTIPKSVYLPRPTLLTLRVGFGYLRFTYT
jgi:hypothetical protein